LQSFGQAISSLCGRLKAITNITINREIKSDERR